MKMARMPEYLQAYLEKFPLQAGPLLTSIKDLSLCASRYVAMKIVC